MQQSSQPANQDDEKPSLRDVMLAQPLNDLERLDWLDKDDVCYQPVKEGEK